MKGTEVDMGDNNLNGNMLYVIDYETGEEHPIGKGIPELHAGGYVTKESTVLEEPRESMGSMVCNIKFKKITKKRFIKLLMANEKIQRNDALKLYKTYMREYKRRSRIGLTLFLNNIF